jgi:hypothetical protein
MPITAHGACGKSIEFIHMVYDDLAMLYFTDGTYLLIKYDHGYQGKAPDGLQFEYVEEEMGS